MSSSRSSVVWPGPGRITLVLLALVPAAMAYPWPTTRDRWVLGIAVAVTVALLGWWRGMHFTTILRRRVGMLRQGSGERGSGADVRATAVLRVVPPADHADYDDALPLPLITGYLDRYGLRADTVRVTSRDSRSETAAPGRETWIGLTLSAAENLAALQARSSRIPLHETVEVAVRRLADHLREIGWETAAVDADGVPDLFSAGARETWRAVTDNATDYVAAYRVHADEALADTLKQIASYGAPETWTAVEVAGDGEHRTVAAACALRTQVPPAGAGPVPGMTAENGGHRSALEALQPFSGRRLAGHAELPESGLSGLVWRTAPDVAAAAVTRSRARHAAARA